MKKTKTDDYGRGEMALDAVVSMILSTTVRAIADSLGYFTEQQVNNIVFNTIFDSTAFGLGSGMGRYLRTKNSENSVENSVSSGAVASSGSVIGHALYYFVRYSG